MQKILFNFSYFLLKNPNKNISTKRLDTNFNLLTMLLLNSVQFLTNTKIKFNIFNQEIIKNKYRKRNY